jgi:uncharacterized protein (TIGR02246 family)
MLESQETTEAQKTTDDDAARALYFQLLDSWNQRNAEGMASLYAADGYQVGFDGSTFEGPQAIAGGLAPIFKDHPTAAFVGKIRSVRFPARDVARVVAAAGMVPPGRSEIMPERNALQTMVAVRKEGRWQVHLFQNTPARFDGRPEAVQQLTAELQQIYDSRPR